MEHAFDIGEAVEEVSYAGLSEVDRRYYVSTGGSGAWHLYDGDS